MSISSALTAIGVALSTPFLLLLLIACACALIVAVIIVRVGDAYDKACADLIDAHTAKLDEKYPPPEKPRP